ncbi:MAG: calcium/sodium antiporter [Paludibacteraceae bacterium]|nr:calcium/sodium antiporter [Paludibacteraceae bacterium]
MFEFLNTWLTNGGFWVAIPLIVLGCVALIKGAGWLVDGASGLAKKYGISDIVIGLTVVAFGTSMPEFVVNMVAVGQGNTEIAITNVLGSNIINTFVILGVTALICSISSQRQSRRFDIPWSALGALLVLAIVTCVGFMPRITGAILLVFFAFYLWQTFKHAKTSNSDENYTLMSPKKSLLLILVGLLLLVVGGEFIVKSATNIAQSLGVSDAIIGLTVVALGTSLPELATSCMAAMKGNCDIALGNVIGSNIFNIFFILGTSASVMPLPGYQGLQMDAIMAALGSILVLGFVYLNKSREIKRWHGAILLLVYGGYLTYRILTL